MRNNRDNKYKNLKQIGLGILIVIGLNYLASLIFYRFDLTSEKRYTLTSETKQILSDLQAPVNVQVFLDGDMPLGFAKLQKGIKEMLDELVVYAGENLDYQFVDPRDITDKEEREELLSSLDALGVKPVNAQMRAEGGSSQQILFPGAIISFGELNMGVNLLKNNPGLTAEDNLNNSLKSLEYEFMNAIYNLSRDEYGKVAFIEGYGEFNEHEVGDISEQLSVFYEVHRGRINGKPGSLDDFKAVIIAGPVKPYSEADKFVIDQYIMNGGRVLWLIDAVNVDTDSLTAGSTVALINQYNLEDMLFRYGVRINPNLIQDIQSNIIPVNTGLAGGQAQWTPVPWLYYPLLNPVGNHPVTRDINLLLSRYVSSMDTLSTIEDVRKTVLLSSSPHSRLVTVPAIISLDEIKRTPSRADFVSPGFPVAVLLEGQFESIFRNRVVSGFTGDTPGFKYRDKSLHTRLIVMSDADLIRNEVRYTPQGPVVLPLGYDRYTRQTFGNSDLILNAINYLADDAGIMNIRSRELTLRLLDKARINEEKTRWQWLNMLVPIAIVSLLVGGFALLRRYRYARV